MKKFIFYDFYIPILISVLLVLPFAFAGENKTQQQKIIIHKVDNAGGSIVGKVTDKEIIEGHYTVTVGAYGKFLVTKDQYESVAVGDDVPGFLKNRGN